MNLNFEEKKIAAENWFKSLRNSICAEFEKIEYIKSSKKKLFKKNNWKAGGNSKGGGTFALIENGSVFEKVGVNISTISGKFHKQFRKKIPGALNNPNFWASGISIVAHMKNPKVPAFHFNTRFIVTSRSWFGGGMDLTPYYGYEEDAVHFHRTCRDALAPFGADFHPRYKQWCDRYFYLPHRAEPRGIGGIFFDDLDIPDFATCFALTCSVGDHFLPAYVPIVERRRDLSYGEFEREFQAYRRGRYVEFNLVHDRGTLFGLQSGGRTESILMSLPPVVRWRYNWTPQAGTPEARLYSEFLVAKDWV